MDTKVTLNIDKFVIERAKQYASLHNRSLSGIIESYLHSLTIKDDLNNKNDIQISPFVKSMSTGTHIPSDLDYKIEFSDYMNEKHK